MFYFILYFFNNSTIILFDPALDLNIDLHELQHFEAVAWLVDLRCDSLYEIK